jgi:cell division protein FtsZ
VDRRNFLKGAGVAGLSVPAASSAWSEQLAAIDEFWRSTGFRRRTKVAAIIGVGGAGCNAVLATRASGVLEGAKFTPRYSLIDLGQQAFLHIPSTVLGDRPIKTMALAPNGAGGWVNTARVMALRQREPIKALLTGAEMVVVVSGLGGGTGSGVSPIIARLARNAGIFTVAAVITPFDYEAARSQAARTAIKYLRCEADLVMEFSNDEWSQGRDDVPVADVFAGLDRHIGERIRDVMDNANELRA